MPLFNNNYDYILLLFIIFDVINLTFDLILKIFKLNYHK